MRSKQSPWRGTLKAFKRYICSVFEVHFMCISCVFLLPANPWKSISKRPKAQLENNINKRKVREKQMQCQNMKESANWIIRGLKKNLSWKGPSTQNSCFRVWLISDELNFLTASSISCSWICTPVGHHERFPPWIFLKCILIYALEKLDIQGGSKLCWIAIAIFSRK